MLAKLFAKNRQDEGSASQQRREMREDVVDGTVEIGGVRYPLVNWSYSGFLAKDFTGDHSPGDRVDVEISIGQGRKRFEFISKAALVRIDREGHKLVGAFVEMDRPTRIEIARYFGS